jgi:hypothetical protein
MGIGYSSPLLAVSFSNATVEANLDGFLESRCAGWLDYDRDGNLDLIVGCEYGANRLHRNNGDGTFTDVSDEAGIPDQEGIWGLNFADIDNDGFQEIYLSDRAPDTVSAGRNTLLYNTGQGNFIDISEPSMANVAGGGIAACFAPLDKNSYIDLFIPNQYYPSTQYPHVLLNTGSSTFLDYTTSFGLYFRNWWDVPIVFDYDNDRGLDLFCTMDYHGNAMFKEYAYSYFVDVSDSLNFQTPCGYGATIGDVNNDGWFDLYITNWHNYYDNLFLRDSTGGYVDVTYEWGAQGNYWTSAPHFADFDNDGWEDLFVAAAGEGNKFYRNIAGTGFADETQESGMYNLGYNWGASVGDYNNDGFLDIYVPEYYYSAHGGRLYRNDGNGNSWIKFELQGENSNRDGIGARLYLVSPSTRQTRQVIAGSGFGSQNSLIQHFGLGPDGEASSLTIIWPSGEIDYFENIPANHMFICEEGAGLVAVTDDVALLPLEFRITNIYPNPFNSSARIQIEVESSSYLSIEIVDILGRKICDLFSGEAVVGQKTLIWSGFDDQGRAVSSGVYFCRARNADQMVSAKLTLVK